jgi:protein AbiQ
VIHAGASPPKARVIHAGASPPKARTIILEGAAYAALSAIWEALMQEQLNFYEVDANYIAYLMTFDTHVPRVDYSEQSAHNKFLCGVVLSIREYNYFAPVSSFRVPQRTNVIIRDNSGNGISSVRLSFMVPAPSDVLSVKSISGEPSAPYRNLLNMELNYCRKNANAIYSRARFIYNAVVVKKDPFIAEKCCDFERLERACLEYAKRI